MIFDSLVLETPFGSYMRAVRHRFRVQEGIALPSASASRSTHTLWPSRYGNSLDEHSEDL